MKNKVEFKRAIFCSILVILITNIVFYIINFYEYKTYTLRFNYKIDNIVTVLNEKYPDIDKQDIIKILNSQSSKSDFVLREYGININKDAFILENDKYFSRFLILNISITVILPLIIFYIFLKYNNSKDKKISEITKYIEEINNKNYKLDIEDNTEDELSILKNEIYKVTIMLKEIAENSKKDKKSLKNSLQDISHQLKTPLTSIVIMLDNILDNKQMDIKTQEEFIKDIKREIINVNFLVNALLKLSKIDVNAVKFNKTEEYINNILKSSIKNVAVLCDLKDVQITIEGEEDNKIYCDSNWQIEAITNILKNCVEHSEQNTKIDIVHTQNQIYSKIEISDHGSGIKQKDLPHIFERFYKGENSSYDSVGIGLALSKSIIESNNGYISVQSEENEGTKFVIKYFK